MQNQQTLTNAMNQAVAQSNALYNSDISNENNYTGQYNSALSNEQQQQALINQQAQYMGGAGSGTNLYNQAYNQMGGQQVQSGINSANQNILQLNGMLNGANQQFSQGASNTAGIGGGGSAGAMASMEGNILNPLQAGASTWNTQLGNLNTEQQNVMTGAAQSTTAQVNTESQQLQAYNDAYTAAATQASQAQAMVQQYAQLASTQQGLSASEQQGYEQAINSYLTYTAAAQQAQAAMISAQANAAYAGAETTGQNLTNEGTQNTLNAQAAKAQQAAQAKSNAEYKAMEGQSATSNTGKSSKSSSGGSKSLLDSIFGTFA